MISEGLLLSVQDCRTDRFSKVMYHMDCSSLKLMSCSCIGMSIVLHHSVSRTVILLLGNNGSSKLVIQVVVGNPPTLHDPTKRFDRLEPCMFVCQPTSIHIHSSVLDLTHHGTPRKMIGSNVVLPHPSHSPYGYPQ